MPSKWSSFCVFGWFSSLNVIVCLVSALTTDIGLLVQQLSHQSKADFKSKINRVELETNINEHVVDSIAAHFANQKDKWRIGEGTIWKTDGMYNIIASYLFWLKSEYISS